MPERVVEQRITIELNPDERRLYDRMRSRVVRRSARRRSGFRDMLLMLPDFTVLLSRLMRDQRVPLSGKIVAMFGVAYVLSPIDLLPALLLGPIGLVDDLIVVTAALSRMLNHVHPDVVRAHWSGQGDALEAIQSVTQWSESLFTDRLVGTLRGILRFGAR